ncbi:hypothetical protein GCM10010389_30610 [Streptomyces echinoruber]|uniref:Uncharacterized protein n=1 Tax=Streptomyces echinoruber TaxID=68898 RepID=A0A918VC36_9ACTN|nr:hypothetical protein GCM10010389_30610 [Streptomyces echinoruber]
MPRDTGKPTKRPTVSNDTGTSDGPLGTGARPEGSVWRENGSGTRSGVTGNPVGVPHVHESSPTDRSGHTRPIDPATTAHSFHVTQGKTLT